MYLNVVPSENCSMHQIRIPKQLREEFKLDYGDHLIFDTDTGEYSVQVAKASYEDLMEYGSEKAFVSEHSPVLFSRSSDVYVQPHELTIGCDPELFLLKKKTNLVSPAYLTLPKESQLGSDGDLAELRPDYALCPEQLMLNLRKLILEIPFKLPLSLFPYASSWEAFRCCGFHIHLGLPIELLSFAVEKTDTFLRNIVSALDYFVGIPAAALDPDNKRRFNEQYGKPGDYKLSMRTLEYRTPGGFHLRTPGYTKNLLISAFKITEEIIKDAEKVSKGWTDSSKIVDFNYFKHKYNIPSREYIKSVFLTKDKDKLKEESDKINSQLKDILDEDSKFIVKERYDNEQTLLREWLKYAT